MNLAQTRLVLAATVVAESAWLYATLGVVGVILAAPEGALPGGPAQGGGSPMVWPAILAVLSSSLLVSRMLQSVVMPLWVGYAVQSGLGAVVIWLTVGSQVLGAGEGLDLAWIGRLTSPLEVDGYLFRAWGGIAAGVGLWWRGGRLASSEEPNQTLLAGFKIGVVAVALAVVVDAVYVEDLNIYPIMFLFLSSALAGLAIGNLLPAPSQTLLRGTWPRVIGGMVSGIVVIGVLLGVVLDSVFPFVSRMVRAPYLLLVDTVVEPIARFIAEPINDIIAWAFSLFIPPAREGETPDRGAILREIRESEPGVVGEVIVGLIIAAIVAITFVLLATAFHKRDRGRFVYAAGQGRSIRGDADPLRDMAELLFRLLPKRFRRRRRWRRYSLPEGDPRVVEALRIYYRLLTLAEMGGVARSPAETSSEFQSKLESMFPPRLVRMATAAFDRACYGGQPCPEAELGEMRASVQGLA